VCVRASSTPAAYPSTPPPSRHCRRAPFLVCRVAASPSTCRSHAGMPKVAVGWSRFAAGVARGWTSRVREPAHWLWHGLPPSVGRCVRPTQQDHGPHRHCARGPRQYCATGQRRIRPSDSRFIFLFSEHIQILVNSKICVGFV
jgi:hypothetical protein